MNIVDEYLKSLNYTGNLKYVIFGIDVVLVLALFFILTLVLYKRMKRKIVWLVSFAFFVVFLASVLLKLQLVKVALIATLAIVCVCGLALSNYEVKQGLKNHNNQPVKATSNFITDKNTKLASIDKIVSAVEYLSSRKIGAIITIEKENSLNFQINKGVKIDAEISTELLKTIFFPNTALHDGAVVIRGNRIICAAAIYDLTEKTDLQKELGTRHRAAIGISEQSDAFTIVVSEETGIVSTTLGGTITRNVGEEALRIALDQHIIVR